VRRARDHAGTRPVAYTHLHPERKALSLRWCPLALPVVLAACGGASAPPPPVAVATASPAAADLRPLSSRDGAGTASVTAGRQDAGSIGSGPPIGMSDPHGNVPVGSTTRSAGTISGTVAVARGLPLGAKDVLYLMAKRGTSTIAVRRIDAPRFPLAFEISGEDVMMAGIAFEGPIDLVARLSKSGDAIASRGDLEGSARSLAIPSSGVSLTIDRIRN